MVKFTGRVVTTDYRELHKGAAFAGTYEEYLAHHGLSEMSVKFDQAVRFDSLRCSNGAFVSTHLANTGGLRADDRIEGDAVPVGGGAHVRTIYTVTRRFGR